MGLLGHGGMYIMSNYYPKWDFSPTFLFIPIIFWPTFGLGRPFNLLPVWWMCMVVVVYCGFDCSFLCLVMTLNTFPHVYWPFEVTFCEVSVYEYCLPILYISFLSFYTWFVGILIYLEYMSFKSFLSYSFIVSPATWYHMISWNS